jgi:hypothetical protein
MAKIKARRDGSKLESKGERIFKYVLSRVLAAWPSRKIQKLGQIFGGVRRERHHCEL